jgi:hypothetical protein
MNYPAYSGSRFRPDKGNIKVTHDAFGFATEKQVFIPTSSYVEYLRDKERAMKQHELNVLKNKLDYQYATYKEVDKVDYDQYIHLLVQMQSITCKPTKTTSKISRQVVVTSQKIKA